MVFVIVQLLAVVIATPGVTLLIPGGILLSQQNRRPALFCLIIGFLLLTLGLVLLGWSLYQINVFCPVNPAACG